MKRIVLSLSLLIVLSGCYKGFLKSNRECSKAYKNDYKNITIKKYTTVYKNDTLSFNELHFICTSPILSKELMYNKFGKWDLIIEPEGVYHPILVWKNVALFNDKELYNVYTRGEETHGSYSTAFMVFDQNDKDQIKDSLQDNAIFVEYFSKLIKENKNVKNNFELEYSKILKPREFKIVF